MLIGEDTAMLEQITIGIYIVVPLLHVTISHLWAAV